MEDKLEDNPNQENLVKLVKEISSLITQVGADVRTLKFC